MFARRSDYFLFLLDAEFPGSARLVNARLRHKEAERRALAFPKDLDDAMELRLAEEEVAAATAAMK